MWHAPAWSRPIGHLSTIAVLSLALASPALCQGGVGGAAGGAAGAAAGAAGDAAGAAAGAAGSAAGAAAGAAGGAASAAGTAAGSAAGAVGSAASGAVGTVGNAVSGALGSVGTLGLGGLGSAGAPKPSSKAYAKRRKAILITFQAEGAAEQQRIRRQCVDVMRYPLEYDLGLVDLCRILRTSHRR